MRRQEDYWTARVNKLVGVGQSAQWSEDRTHFHWDNKNVYHGSHTPEINEFRFAEESTIGNHAVYFTIDPVLAMGYARLRGLERRTEEAHLYEATIKDANFMNWAENVFVEKLKVEFSRYCKEVIRELENTDFELFCKKYDLLPALGQSLIYDALQRIVADREKEGYLNGGNIKVIAQGVKGTFFEGFVKSKGCDGIVTIEGGDDPTYTAKPGASVVLFNREKIIRHRNFDIADGSISRE